MCVRRGGGAALHSFILIHSRRRRVDAAPDVAFFRTIALASAITAPSRSRALKKIKNPPRSPIGGSGLVDRRPRTNVKPSPSPRARASIVVRRVASFCRFIQKDGARACACAAATRDRSPRGTRGRTIRAVAREGEALARVDRRCGRWTRRARWRRGDARSGRAAPRAGRRPRGRSRGGRCASPRARCRRSTRWTNEAC